MYLTNKRLSRRAMLQGVGASVALPFLDAMIPARAVAASTLKPPVRLICIEMVHGSAGSSTLGIERNLWAPAGTGRDFDLAPTSLRSLEPFRDALTIVSNTDCANAEPYTVKEVGGDHFRSSAVFLTQAHPKMTEGADVEAGVSLDQLYAARAGRATPLPSMQLSIENIDQGGVTGGYSSQYTDTISWASPTKPLPMIRDPRIAFDELFGVFGSGATPEERRRRRAEDRSILDGLGAAMTRLQSDLGASDRARMGDYLENVREVERRLQAVEAFNGSGEPRGIPEAPKGVPDSFTEHVRMMFDLQLLALQSDITRVFAFKLGRDNSNRVYPESGLNGPFHPTSHHSGKVEKILEFAKLNTFHVGQVAYLLERMRAIKETSGTLLDNSVVLYGSAMGDSNLHNHKRVPFFIAGRASGAIRGGTHIKAPNGTPLANVMLSLLHTLGLEDITQFGDSEGTIAL